MLSLCTTVDPGQKQIVLVGFVDGTIELRQPDLGFRLRATLSNRFSVGHPDQLKAACAGRRPPLFGAGPDPKLMVDSGSGRCRRAALHRAGRVTGALWTFLCRSHGVPS